MTAPIPPHVRDRTVTVIGWTLAVISWVFPFGVVAAGLFGLLWLFQRGTGRLHPAAIALATTGLGAQLWFWLSID